MITSNSTFKWIPKEIPEGNIKVKIHSDSVYAKQFINKQGEKMQLLLLKVDYKGIIFDASYVNDYIDEFIKSVSKGDEIEIYVILYTRRNKKG
jgi:hypothetical protein